MRLGQTATSPFPPDMDVRMRPFFTLRRSSSQKWLYMDITMPSNGQYTQYRTLCLPLGMSYKH